MDLTVPRTRRIDRQNLETIHSRMYATTAAFWTIVLLSLILALSTMSLPVSLDRTYDSNRVTLYPTLIRLSSPS